MKHQLKVIKADSTAEQYFHTKVIGTISNALAGIGQPDICVAEQLAETVTYFLYHRHTGQRVTTSEIFSIIKATLTATDYEEAAVALSEHHCQRELKRCRIEAVSIDISQFSDAQSLSEAEQDSRRSRWNKSRIVADLVMKHKIDLQPARTIASMVEQRVLGMGLTLVPTSLIKQLVLSDSAAVLRAQQQLQIV